MNDFLDGYEIIKFEPRKYLPFEKGEGTLQECIEKFIQLNFMQLKMEGNMKDDKVMEVYCGLIKPQEEKLFNDKLFNMLFDSEYEYPDGLFGDFIVLSESINKSPSYVSKMLMELGDVKIRITTEKGSASTSTIFTRTTIDNLIDSETGKRIENEYYFIFTMAPLFIKACAEVRLEMKK